MVMMMTSILQAIKQFLSPLGTSIPDQTAILGRRLASSTLASLQNNLLVYPYSCAFTPPLFSLPIPNVVPDAKPEPISGVPGFFRLKLYILAMNSL